MTTIPDTKTTDRELVARAREAARQLMAESNSIPDDGDLPGNLSPNERNALIAQRQTLRGHASRVTTEMQAFIAIEPKIDALNNWRDVLRTAQIELSRQLETLPRSDPSRGRKSDSLNWAIRVLNDGPDVAGSGEFLPDVLVEWMQAHGLAMVNGSFFGHNGGGLKNVEATIAKLERQNDEARKELAHRVMTGEALVGATTSA